MDTSRENILPNTVKIRDYDTICFRINPIILMEGIMPDDTTLSFDDVDVLRTHSDAEILDALYRRYGDYIYSLVIRRLQTARLGEDDLRDCYCWVILQLFENGCGRIRKFRGGSAFKTYLTVTCDRLIVDHMRKVIRHERHVELTGDFSDVRSGPDGLLDDTAIADNPELQYLVTERESLVREAIIAVQNAVDAMDDTDRLIFRLRVLDRKSFKEIDGFLDIDNSTYLFKKIVARLRDGVRGKLRREIEELLAEG